MKLMERMKVCVSTKQLLLLCLCFIISSGQKVCDHSAPEGSSYTLPLKKGGVTINHDMQWKHDDNVLFNRKRGKFSKGSAEDIDESGSLILKDLKKTSSGIYKAEVFDANGQTVNDLGTSWNLCVTDKIPTPSVNHTCTTKTVTLYCNVPQPRDLSFKWRENGKDVVNGNQMTLIRTDTGARYTCTVSKPGGSETSLPVTPSCPKEPIFPKDLFGKDKIPKPSVNHTCTTETFTLRCNVPQPQGLSFTWSENGEEVPDVNQMNLTRPVDTESTFTCTVFKPGGSETSDPLKPSCTKGDSPEQGSFFPEKLFGLDFWLVVGIFACGIALLLTLITICCCGRARRRRQRKMEEEGGYRMDPTDQHQQQQQQQQEQQQQYLH